MRWLLQVVVGIPFYTERDNVVSQLVTLRQVSTRRKRTQRAITTAHNRVFRRCQVFQERRQYSLIVVIGEHSRCDLLEDIAIDDIEESEKAHWKKYVPTGSVTLPLVVPFVPANIAAALVIGLPVGELAACKTSNCEALSTPREAATFEK